AAIVIVLLPSILFSRWTLEDTRLRGRAIFHVISSGALLLFVLPESVFALLHRTGWNAFVLTPAWVRNLEFQIIAILGVGGVSAVQEFARRGGGTPIPFDAPKRLVTSGLYRYVANPMQFSCAIVLTTWGVVLQDWWVFTAGLIAFVYGIGLA